MKQIFFLVHDLARQNALAAVKAAPDNWCVEVKERTRTLDQNALLWPLLTTLSEQVVWHGQHLAAEEWKEVLSAALNRQKVVPGVDGGFVVLGSRTSRMSKSEFSELIDLIYAFGVEQGVTWQAQGMQKAIA